MYTAVCLIHAKATSRYGTTHRHCVRYRHLSAHYVISPMWHLIAALIICLLGSLTLTLTLSGCVQLATGERRFALHCTDCSDWVTERNSFRLRPIYVCVCVCVCVYVCVYLYVCMYVCMCVFVCMCTYYVCMYVCMYVGMDVCIFFLFIYTACSTTLGSTTCRITIYLHVFPCYVCMYVCRYACMYICRYVCT